MWKHLYVSCKTFIQTPPDTLDTKRLLQGTDKIEYTCTQEYQFIPICWTLSRAQSILRFSSRVQIIQKVFCNVSLELPSVSTGMNRNATGTLLCMWTQFFSCRQYFCLLIGFTVCWCVCVAVCMSVFVYSEVLELDLLWIYKPGSKCIIIYVKVYFLISLQVGVVYQQRQSLRNLVCVNSVPFKLSCCV